MYALLVDSLTFMWPIYCTLSEIYLVDLRPDACLWWLTRNRWPSSRHSSHLFLPLHISPHLPGTFYAVRSFALAYERLIVLARAVTKSEAEVTCDQSELLIKHEETFHSHCCPHVLRRAGLLNCPRIPRARYQCVHIISKNFDFF